MKAWGARSQAQRGRDPAEVDDRGEGAVPGGDGGGS